MKPQYLYDVSFLLTEDDSVKKKMVRRMAFTKPQEEWTRGNWIRLEKYLESEGKGKHRNVAIIDITEAKESDK